MTNTGTVNTAVRTKLMVALAVTTVVLFAVLGFRENEGGRVLAAAPAQTATVAHRNLPETQVGLEDDDIMVEILKERLQSHELLNVNGTLPPHQFLHLHHMKTGGTSVDDLLKCSVSRMQQVQGLNAKHYSLHECSGSHFKKCLEGSEICLGNLHDAALMSYCAPLKFLTNFGWLDAPKESDENDRNRPATPDFWALTVLRHPVERVWSNYRFSTRGCYKCMQLKDIYKAFDDGTLEDGDQFRKDSLCVKQLMNHQTINLLSSDKYESANGGIEPISEQKQTEMVHEAIDNMKNFFTMIGVTEELGTFGEMIPKVFPFMAPMIPGSHRACHLPHSNKSPSNNHCGPDKTHMELPAHPDEDTKKLIEEHNQMDIQLYEAAVKQFQLQKKALGFD